MSTRSVLFSRSVVSTGVLALLAGSPALAQTGYEVRFFELEAPPSPMPDEPHYWDKNTRIPGGLEEFGTAAAAGGSVGGYNMSIKNFRPVVWREGEAISLIPTRNVEPEADFGSVWAVSGNQQVGWIGGAHRAAMWNGSSESYVRLHPDGPPYGHSYARGTNGRYQVGQIGQVGVGNQAVRWEGSQKSMVSLHPSGYAASDAYATTDDHQVGCAWDGQFRMRAMIWAGSATTAIDLHDNQYYETIAFGLGALQQVGIGSVGSTWESPRHALLWHGLDESRGGSISLHPEWAFSSYAYGTNDQNQVGFVQYDQGPYWESPRAAAWSGSAESYVDLHAALNSGDGGDGSEWKASVAQSIDSDGVIYGVAIRHGNEMRWTAVTWTPTSQPCAADFNGDGQVNFFDLSAYLEAFGLQDPAADLAPPFGVWNFFDLSAYIGIFNQGCP